MKSASSNQELKKMVGIAAADLVKDGMAIGIGTGSTVAFFIEALGERVKNGLHITGVTTSYQSKLSCHSLGIPTVELSMVDRLDLAIDGADEIDAGLHAIKGGGAAHTIEKIVATMADEFVVIGDESKCVKQLAEKFPVPVEVLPPALALVTRKIRESGADPRVRMGMRKDGPVVTDSGNLVIDIYFTTVPDLQQYNLFLKSIPGVVETGLFLGIAKKALIARGDGVVTLTPQK